MSTSGSYDFAMTRNDLIQSACETAGIVGLGQTLPSNLLTAGTRKLNMLIKAWEAEGINLWTRRHATIFLEADTSTYSLGPSGDQATDTAVQTTISADEASGQTVLSVTSVTGITALDNIGIEQDDGTIKWTTVASVGASTVTVNNALTDEASSGNIVYVYTSLMRKPLEILSASVRNSDLVERQIIVSSRDEFFAYPDRTSSGTINAVYYQRGLDANGTLHVYMPPSDVKSTIQIEYTVGLQDFDSASDNPDLPSSWLLALEYNLAALLCSGAGKEQKKVSLLADAERYKIRAQFANKEVASIYIVPDSSDC